MLRLFILALLIYGLLVFLRKTGSKIGAKRPRGQNLPTGEMVSCAHCGTFVLKSSCIDGGKGKYCSEDCKTKG